jgi:hypothetical protein
MLPIASECNTGQVNPGVNGPPCTAKTRLTLHAALPKGHFPITLKNGRHYACAPSVRHCINRQGISICALMVADSNGHTPAAGNCKRNEIYHVKPSSSKLVAALIMASSGLTLTGCQTPPAASTASAATSAPVTLADFTNLALAKRRFRFLQRMRQYREQIRDDDAAGRDQP